jgi:DMSO reductase family type II enzyme heme b subunit
MKNRLALALALTTTLAFAAACGRAPVRDLQQVTAVLAGGALPAEDPGSRLWDRAPEHPARLMVQDVVEPRLTTPGVEVVAVRALHDGNRIAFRLEWGDATRDISAESGRSSDAAALQFPVVSGADVPDAAMGERGKGVRIWYWKALWQDDAERAASGGKDRIAALYPNASIDHYPFAAAAGDARAEFERRYAPARAAGNPIAERGAAGPVQVLAAEGYGNVAPATQTQAGAGRGTWSDGRWVVTIARPLRPGPDMGVLEPGGRSYIAFAVWDGSARHTGSRKMRSGWTRLVLEGAP